MHLCLSCAVILQGSNSTVVIIVVVVVLLLVGGMLLVWGWWRKRTLDRTAAEAYATDGDIIFNSPTLERSNASRTALRSPYMRAGVLGPTPPPDFSETPDMLLNPLGPADRALGDRIVEIGSPVGEPAAMSSDWWASINSLQDHMPTTLGDQITPSGPSSPDARGTRM